MTDYVAAAAAATVAGLVREYRADEAGTLEHLLDVCQDAALGARLAAEIFTDDAELATFFEEIATDRDRFATRLALLIADTGHGDEIDSKGTFRGKLFHWRLQLATRIFIGEHEATDRRVNLNIIRMGSNQVLKDYEKAEGRDLSPEAHKEVHRQAERIRATNARIRKLAEGLK